MRPRVIHAVAKWYLFNLLDKSTPGPAIRRWSLQREQEGIACTVRGTGPGIPEEHLPHMTRRFYREVYSAANETHAEKIGVKRVILPKPGHKSKARRQHERRRWFKRGAALACALDMHSFPSGYAGRNACYAVVLWPLLTPPLRIGLLVWLGLLGLSRVALGIHYASDVLAGFVVGAGVEWGIRLVS